MKLYEINQTLLDLLEKGFIEDPETGEILYDQADIDQLKIDFNEKLEGIACWIKDETATVNALDQEIKSLTARKQTHKKKILSLSDYVLKLMSSQDLKSFETPKAKISVRKSHPVLINDELDLPKKYLIKQIDYKPDKKAIGEALKSGKKVRGAELLEKKNISIK